ncbi:MAG: PQQ-binding-like beta-propeller repeat protein [Planctomycetales bacterium]|nr:PQQ-binding-like beta-propeller repeat protein [Planctomycetales bacterium]
MVRKRFSAFGLAVFALVIGTALSASAPPALQAADWPMWRRDAARTATSEESLPEKLHLQWTRALPAPAPAYRAQRLQFDAGYEPVVVGKTLVVCVPANNSVVAMDTESGEERWRRYLDGPPRLAPAVWNDLVLVGADDGCIYCLSLADGSVAWKFRAVPSRRCLLGNRRMISAWPVRGGPVVADGVVYFAAGVWPLEGVFLYALEATSGKLVWHNDSAGTIFGPQPHGAESLGGVSPQGYLALQGEDLVVPCGQALPAYFDRSTGRLKEFALPTPGRLPGGWFAAFQRGSKDLLLDAQVNSDQHEDKVHQGKGTPGVRSTIYVGDREFKFSEELPGITGDIHTMLAADGKLFVVNRAGQLHALGANEPEQVVRHTATLDSLPQPTSPPSPFIRQTVASAGKRHGYALVWGIENERLLDALLAETRLRVIAADADAAKVAALRRRYDAAGLYGERITILADDPQQIQWPRYFADVLCVAGDGQHVDFQVLRPYGGVAVLAGGSEPPQVVAEASATSKEFTTELSAELCLVRRRGPLTGGTNYTGGWRSEDALVRAPLGVLWFDDTLGHFKRSPQPLFVDGVMISHPKDWRSRHSAGARPPYDLLPTVLSDVYTGRVFADDEARPAALEASQRGRSNPLLSQYRPPYQKDDWKPETPRPGERVNPLTGEKEPRVFPKSYGCDGGVDYGFLYTMRSGAAAFYDKRLESGTSYIAGPRSGCTNSIIPACGVLNVPYFYEGCTCSYPLPVGLALVAMPPEFEQWACWGPGQAEAVRRVGVNLGAPGDRMTEEGTLWLDIPSRGGPSPELQVDIQPKTAQFYYNHALRIRGGEGWPWVAASGVLGARTIAIRGLVAGEYRVRLVFAEPADAQPGERSFDVALNGANVLEAFDIARAAGGAMRGCTQDFEAVSVAADGVLTVALDPVHGTPVLSGIEIVGAGTELAPAWRGQR